MDTLYRDIFINTIVDIYPIYMRNEILTKTVENGLVINNKKASEQCYLNFNNSIDVTSIDDIDDKIRTIMQNESVVNYIEEYEYLREYRHFCYFKYSDFDVARIKELASKNTLNVFEKIDRKSSDSFDMPTIYAIDQYVFFKFTKKLKNDSDTEIKYTTIAVLDKKLSVLELRLDRIGIAYKNSYNFYKEIINDIITYFKTEIHLTISNIDFKAVIEYIKSEKSDITIYAQKMNRNGTTAYLEAYDDGEGVIPILGELTRFIENNKADFDKNEETNLIRNKLHHFIKEIEVKSDMPMVKVKMDSLKIKFGITHNYKDTEYSLFMLYGDLSGDKEMMNNVRAYLIGCYDELNKKISAECIPKE